MSQLRPYGDAGPLIAAALGGGEAELQVLARRPDLRALVITSRVAPALALRAALIGLSGREIEAWHVELVTATTRGLMLRHALAGIAAAFAREQVPWAPLKGLGLSPHVYAAWEERPAGDIDVLIGAQDFERARAALRAIGWTESAGAADPSDEAFLRDEGYNWKAVEPGGAQLELHFRLWGCAPDGLAASVLTRAAPDPAAGATARRLRLADAWVVAAIHWWTTVPVRPLVYLWDLHRVAGAGDDRLASDVLGQVRRWGLELFAAPVAAAVAELWDDQAHRTIAAGARAAMRRPEQMALERIERASVERAGLELVSLARLLAGRRSRMGWKAAWRRVWPHPAVLRLKTPAEWGWARRRAWFAASRLGLVRRADG